MARSQRLNIVYSLNDIGGRHGATNIDNNFLKIFLPEKLGDQEYEKFLKLGGGHGEHRSGAHTVLRPG